MTFALETATTATDDLVAALNALLPQLAPSAAPTNRAALAATLAQADLTLLLARDAAGIVVGTATLFVVRTLTGRHARLEDVVVDEAARGRGIGEALTLEAIRLARERGAVHMDLTSAPHRQAARRLYERLGFKCLATTCFRLILR